MRNDSELMAEAVAGDLDAFGELISRHQRTAWNIAWRMLGDGAEAEDAAQEAFLRIFQTLERYRPTASFHTYLYRVVTNICLDRARKMKPIILGELPSIPHDSPDPADETFDRERNETMRAAIKKLPPAQRAAIILRHFEELSYREIADSMETSEKAVEKLLSRARKTLAKKLEKMERDA